MAYSVYTQSFGPAYANGTVTITNSTTGVPAIVMAATTGGVLNTLGQATLDSSGNLSVIIDTAQTWNIVAFSGDDLHAVQQLTNTELQAVKTSVASSTLGNKVNINAQTGTAYTLFLTDAGAEVQMNNASANTVTIPPNSSVAFPVNTRLVVRTTGAGLTTIAAGAGVTLVKPAARSYTTSALYEAATLTQLSANTWLVYAS